MQRLPAILCILAAALAAPATCAAEGEMQGPGALNPTTPQGASIGAPFDAGYASNDRVNEIAGNYSFAMDRCDQNPYGDDKRVVRVKISLTGNLDPAVGATLLLYGAGYAWTQCPRPVVNPGFNTPNGQFLYNVSEVDVYGSDDVLILQGSLGGSGLKGDLMFGPGGRYEWVNVHWVAAERAQQAADQAAKLAEQQAQANAQAARDALQATADAERAAARKHAGDTFVAWVRGIFFLGIGFMVWSQRLNILRLWYSLTPHPAADEVSNVVDFGRPYDPDRLARVLRRSPDNPIEREVRAKQAAELLRKLNANSTRTQAELDEETAYLKTQAGLAEGLEMHERIKRRLDAILRAQGKRA